MKLIESEKRINFPIYFYNITIVKTNNIVKSREKRNNKLGLYKSKKDDSYIGGMHSHMSGEPDGYLFLNKYSDENVITHEACHAVSRMFSYIGAEFEEEIFAYTLGYLVEQVHNFLKK